MKKIQLTTSGGNPVADNQNRERIPERTVHAKGTAAYGTLTIAHDITKYSMAVSS